MCSPRKAQSDRSGSRRRCLHGCSRPEAQQAGYRSQGDRYVGAHVEGIADQSPERQETNGQKAGKGKQQLRNQTLGFGIKFCGWQKPAETSDPYIPWQRTLQGEAERPAASKEHVHAGAGLFLCFLLLLLGRAQTVLCNKLMDPSVVT